MRFSWRFRKQFYEVASAQLDNGRPLTDVLKDFSERAQRRGRKALAEHVYQVYRLVRDGKTLVEAMGKDLSDLERSVLDTGERAGDLSASMSMILDVRERTGRLRQKMQSSFFSPAVYMVTLYITLFMIGDYVVPQFANAVPVSRWTDWAYVMYLMGEVATSWVAPVTLIVLVSLAGWVTWLLPRWTGDNRVFFDKYIIPFTLYREISGYTWISSFVALMRAGVPDVDALETQIKTANPWLASRLRPIQAALRDGLDLGAALRRSGYEFPSQDMIDEIAAYAAYRDFAVKIDKVCRTYADVLERQVMIKAAIVAGVFSLFMYLAFVLIQLGSNTISSMVSTSMGGAF